MRKIKIGPETRIEGHLDIKTGIENNVTVDAQCASEMFRGFETILQGRDPLDTERITRRIRGVCPYAHAIASSYAQKSAYHLNVPRNGRILLNLVLRGIPQINYLQGLTYSGCSMKPGDKGCLFKPGCPGPDTPADCSAKWWNGGRTWCMDSNAPCTGCVSPDFTRSKSIPFFRLNEDRRRGNFKRI